MHTHISGRPPETTHSRRHRFYGHAPYALLEEGDVKATAGFIGDAHTHVLLCEGACDNRSLTVAVATSHPVGTSLQLKRPAGLEPATTVYETVALAPVSIDGGASATK